MIIANEWNEDNVLIDVKKCNILIGKFYAKGSMGDLTTEPMVICHRNITRIISMIYILIIMDLQYSYIACL